MLNYDKMKDYQPVPYEQPLPYPVIAQLKAYTEHYRQNYMDRVNPNKGFHRYQHNEWLEILVIGGIDDYFLLYAYPPAGFVISDPDDILILDLWQGFILEWLWSPKVYRLDINTPEHGEAPFKSRKTELGY